MGSRAVLLVCRSPAAAQARFGVPDGPAADAAEGSPAADAAQGSPAADAAQGSTAGGAIWTRTGRPFFPAGLTSVLVGQVRDSRPSFSKADAESIKMPTLFIGGARTKGLLPKVLHTLAAHVADAKTAMIPNTTHPMFEQAPQAFSEIVLNFLAG